MLSENPYIALTHTEYNGKKLDKEIRMSIVVATEVIVNSQFTAKLAQDGQSATLTHIDSAGKTRSWRVEILGGKDPIGLDQDRADAIAQLFNECKALQDPLLGKRASEGPLIINTQKSLDASISWQWSTKSLDGKGSPFTSFKVDAKSQAIFTTLFTSSPTPSIPLARRPRGAQFASIGLSNFKGNICWFNAGLQCLLAIPNIKQFLEQKFSNHIEQEQSLQKKLLDFVVAIEADKSDSEKQQQVRALQQAITTDPIFLSCFSTFGEQELDASEFLFQIGSALKWDEKAEMFLQQTGGDAPTKERGEQTQRVSNFFLRLLDGRSGDGGWQAYQGGSIRFETISIQNWIKGSVAENGVAFFKNSEYEAVDCKTFGIRLLRENGLTKYPGLVTGLLDEVNLQISGPSRTLVPLAWVCHIGEGSEAGHYFTIRKEGEQYVQYNDIHCTVMKKQDVEKLLSTQCSYIQYEVSKAVS